jgi:hypothetical protein
LCWDRRGGLGFQDFGGRCDELLKLTDVFFTMFSGMRGGSMAVTSGGIGFQYDVEKGSMDLIPGSVPRHG